MKVALCFSGQVRDFSRTIKSLQKHILRPLRSHDVFLFCHTPASGSSPSNFGLRFAAIHREEHEPNEFSFLHNRSVSHSVDARPWNQSDPLYGYVRQLRSTYLANNLQQTFSQVNGINFDLVFRLRFDNLYVQSLESLTDLDSEALYVPGHDNWGGINDRFAFGTPSVMNIYCSRFLSLSKYIEDGIIIYPEKLLAHHLRLNSIPVRRTQVVHHLYRHKTLNKAVFKSDELDVPTLNYPQPISRIRFHIKRLIGNHAYDRLAYLWWSRGI